MVFWGAKAKKACAADSAQGIAVSSLTDFVAFDRFEKTGFPVFLFAIRLLSR